MMTMMMMKKTLYSKRKKQKEKKTKNNNKVNHVLCNRRGPRCNLHQLRGDLVVRSHTHFSAAAQLFIDTSTTIIKK